MARWNKRPSLILLGLASTFFATPEVHADVSDLAGTKPGDLQMPDSFADADSCDNCHGGGTMGDFTVLPHDGWAGTMMANAARDPVFLAALTIANQDSPGIGSYCLRCHSPIAFVRGHATPADGSALDTVDLQGVGCETCHRGRHAPRHVTPYYIGNAQLYFDDSLYKNGPYVPCDPNDPVAGCSFSNAHEVAQDLALASSEFCGQCHQVDNPARLLRDETGAETEFSFPLDSTYQEWKQSDHGAEGPTHRSCQDCHMLRKSGSWPLVKGFGGTKRSDPRTHLFGGGNLWGIDAVAAANPERASAYPRAFEVAKEATRAMLASAVAVSLVDPPASLEPGREYEVGVRVENLSGHKFPTGYAAGRRAWLALVVATQSTETFFAGAYDAESGTLAPSPPPREYSATHGRWIGNAAQADHHLALQDMIISDTRIPPKGFIASATTVPKGPIEYGQGPSYRNFDFAMIKFRSPDTLFGKVRLEARVYYQSMTREHVEFLHAENRTDQRGKIVEEIYRSTGRAPPVLVAAQTQEYDFTQDSSTSTGSASPSPEPTPPIDLNLRGGCSLSAPAQMGGSRVLSGPGTAVPTGAVLALAGLWLRRKRATKGLSRRG